ncbi:tetratricopeptide repeat protein [Planctomycetota bacterium]
MPEKLLRIAIVVFLGALLLRGLYLVEFMELPEFQFPAVDGRHRDYVAWHMAGGTGELDKGTEDPQVDSTPYLRPPLYPFFLSLIYRVCGHDYVAARAAQALLGSVSCVLACLVAAHLYGHVVAALCGVAAATYWVLIYYDVQLREPVLVAFLMLTIVLTMFSYRREPGAGKALLCGGLIGLSTLVRPNLLLFIPLAAAWCALVLDQAVTRRRRMVLGLLVLSGAALAISPATIRNYLRSNEFVLISSYGGINLYANNNPEVLGLEAHIPKPLPELRSAFDYPAFVRYVEAKTGRKVTHSEVSGYFVRQTVEFALSNPLHLLQLVGKRLLVFWWNFEIPTERDLNSSRRESPLLRLLPLDFGAVLSCGLLGLLLTFVGPWRREQFPRHDLVLILLLLGTYYLSYFLVFPPARHRAPLVPFVATFAGYFIFRLGVMIRERKAGRAIACIVAAVCLYGVTSVNYFDYHVGKEKATFDRAVAYERHGNWEEAVRYYRRALEYVPRDYATRNNLGGILCELEEFDEAISHLGEAVKLMPESVAAAANLARARRLHQGKLASCGPEGLSAVPRAAREHVTEGNVLAGQDRIDAAVEQYQQAIAVRPDFAVAHFKLAGALQAQGRTLAATDEYRAVLRCNPNHAEGHNNLGSLLAAEGHMAEAILSFRQALLLNPDYEIARKNLERALSMQR